MYTRFTAPTGSFRGAILFVALKRVCVWREVVPNVSNGVYVWRVVTRNLTQLMTSHSLLHLRRPRHREALRGEQLRRLQGLLPTEREEKPPVPMQVSCDQLLYVRARANATRSFKIADVS